MRRGVLLAAVETENGFIRSFGPDWTFLGETIDPGSLGDPVSGLSQDADTGNWVLTQADPAGSAEDITVDIPDSFVAAAGAAATYSRSG